MAVARSTSQSRVSRDVLRAFFEQRVVPDTFDHPTLGTPCHTWTGSRGARSDGTLSYGQASVRGERWYAHRLAWHLAHAEPIPPGLLVCHHCDNPVCVNAAHLFLGTDSDNHRDKVRKGRNRKRHADSALIVLSSTSESAADLASRLADLYRACERIDREVRETLREAEERKNHLTAEIKRILAILADAPRSGA